MSKIAVVAFSGGHDRDIADNSISLQANIGVASDYESVLIPIVARDEREIGERALLNLGHTFGHALEAAAGFSGRLLHGEAIALGMTLAFAFSVETAFAPRPPARFALTPRLRLRRLAVYNERRFSWGQT